jgi:hypothetical protein
VAESVWQGFWWHGSGQSKDRAKGDKLYFVMTHNKISRIPKGQTVSYAHVVVDFCPQKEDPHCIQITAGNFIKYPGKLLKRTSSLITSKLMFKSVLCTKDAKYMCLDIKNFYLSAPLNKYEYMKMPLALFPEWIRMQYNLDKLASTGLFTLRCAVQRGASPRLAF